MTGVFHFMAISLAGVVRGTLSWRRYPVNSNPHLGIRSDTSRASYYDNHKIVQFIFHTPSPMAAPGAQRGSGVGLKGAVTALP